MRYRTKWVAAGIAAAGLGPWLPGWMTAAGLDVWNVPALRRQVDANLRDVDRITGEIADAQVEIQAKERLADELIAGRMTLADATDRFETMVNGRPRMMIGLRCMYPDAKTDRERVALHVIEYTKDRLTDPAEKNRIWVRMATEMAVLFPDRPAGPTGMGTVG
ncbi:MAG TPA: hypothetical protein VH092_02880 [Urbifossiella sp.]|jgi:hypothetical protein|nr:hypothetical protein [Urbifossiella sp.]